MKRKVLFAFGLVGMMAVGLSSCGSSDEPSDKPERPGEFVADWKYIVDNENTGAKYTFLSERYLGVEAFVSSDGLPKRQTAPELYPGLVCMENDFGSDLQTEIVSDRQPVGLYSQMGDHLLLDREDVRPGAVVYQSFCKDLLASDDYKEVVNRDFSPTVFAMCDVMETANVPSLFTENAYFGGMLSRILAQDYNADAGKTLAAGKILINGLVMGIDAAADGFFTKKPDNIAELAAVKQLDYGATAYFFVISDRTFDAVYDCFRGFGEKNNIVEDFKTGELKDSRIVAFVTNDVTRNARIVTSVEELCDFIRHPFTANACGYPVSARLVPCE
ncbi:hypothetical protein [uncultured Duncaniella sp.]|uniref:hypothetical protein n=1 Tax=uncultured Duncaniella sp. TaxID=2768039 RepID=UPI002623B3ED|nr:hypothetical protein [uncultured Duncaniella sp.]